MNIIFNELANSELHMMFIQWAK